MAKNCRACNDLREYAPEFVQNGVTENICHSLENNTGLNPSLAELHTDKNDLHDVNDCLIGGLEDEIEAFGVCNWRQFMKKFIPNIYNTIKAIVCSMSWCCPSNNAIRIDEDGALDETDGTYLVAGHGVSYLIPNAETDEWTGDVKLIEYGQEILKCEGGCRFFAREQTDTTDPVNGWIGEDGHEPAGKHPYSFDTTTDDGFYEPTKRTDGVIRANEAWGDGHFPNGIDETSGKDTDELVYEWRIKKEQHPKIGKGSSGNGFDAYGGAFHVRYIWFDEGEWAYGKEGRCHEDGTPEEYEGGGHSSHGHKVKEGYVYLQCRLEWTTNGRKMGNTNGSGKKRSPNGYVFYKENRQ